MKKQKDGTVERDEVFGQASLLWLEALLGKQSSEEDEQE